jgi:tetratricopeptide (TPR) repeat protein
MPEWLREAAREPEAEAPVAQAAGMPEAQAEHEPEAPAEELEGDEALAWLEALATRHAAGQEEPTAAPEATTEAMPEWLREAMAEPEPEAAEAPPSTTPPPTPEPLPDWLAAAAEVPEGPPELYEAEPVAEAGAAQAAEEWPEEIWPPAPDQEVRIMTAPALAHPMPAPEPPHMEPTRVPAQARAVSLRRAPHRAARPRPSAQPAEVRLESARARLQAGQRDEALDEYESLILERERLDTVVADLESVSEQAQTRRLLRALGDAYMRQDRLQKALDTYKQALGQA